MFKDKLKDYLKSTHPILAIETSEEARCLEDIARCIYELRHEYPERHGEDTMVCWDEGSGPHDYFEEGRVSDKPTKYVSEGWWELPLMFFKRKSNDTANLMRDLDAAWSMFDPRGDGGSMSGGVLVIRDLGPKSAGFRNSGGWRRLKSVAQVAHQCGIVIILIAPSLQIPEHLQNQVQFVDYPMPDRDGYARMFEEFMTDATNNIKAMDSNLSLQRVDGDVERVVDQLLGMTESQARNALNLMAVRGSQESRQQFGGPHRFLELDSYYRGLFEEKVSSLRDSALHYHPVKGGFETVGGLGKVKRWAEQRRLGFTQDARELGLPYPKGCLITGIKGTGKTLIAHAMAAQMDFPFFRLDIGSLFGGVVGETEAKTRHLIQLLEGLGKALIFIDEIEKYLSQEATSGRGDSGVSSRMFGHLLSWLSDKTVPIFLVGTSNNIDRLPTEFTRKGRFDEIFFVDLPNPLERAQIFEVLLKNKFGRDMTLDQNEQLIEKTDQFSGAEIESLIQESLYDLLGDGASVTDESLRQRMLDMVSQGRIIPHAKVDPEGVEAIRNKSQNYTRATDNEFELAANGVVKSMQAGRRATL